MIYKLLTFAFLALFIECSTHTTENTTGGASETVNATLILKDTAIFVNIKAESTLSADIIFTDAEYNPVLKSGICDTISIVTSSAGVLYKGRSGKYNVFIIDRDFSKSVYFPSVSIAASVKDTLTDTLSGNSSIHGSVNISSIDNTSSPDIIPAFVILKGTPWSDTIDENNTYSLSDIPGGFYKISAFIQTVKLVNTDGYQYLDQTVYPTVDQSIDVGREGDSKEMTIYFSR